MKDTLPQLCQDFIRAYKRLDFGQGRFVGCPYFQNKKQKQRFGTSSEVGKGSPEQIITETRARAAMHWHEFSEASASEIRSFMQRQGIGVDCSGFVAHVLAPWLKKHTGSTWDAALTFKGEGWLQKLRFRLRPFLNTNVALLTHNKNCDEITLQSIKPGDLIRTRGGKHVLLISEVEKDEAGNPSSFTYVHSSEAFDEESGVREGIVRIKDSHASLEQQEWEEEWRGKKPTLNGWLEKRAGNGIFRLKCLKENLNYKTAV